MNLVLRVTASCACAALLVTAAIPPKALVSVPKYKTQVRTGLVFEPNVGQADPEVRWISRTPDRTLLLTQTEARMLLRGADGETRSVSMKVAGSSRTAKLEGVEKLPSFSNYFIGNDPSQWRSGVPHYSRVKYTGVYPGVDLVYYSTDRQLEYDFIVAPGVDPNRIQLVWDGADRLEVAANGDLLLQVNGRVLRQLRPKVYQNINGQQHEVASSYKIRSGNRVEFALAKYDRSRELVIDPVLQYSTYFGHQGTDTASGVAVDRTGDIYLGGETTSVRFTTSGQAQPDPGGDSDAFIAKFNGSGINVWTTYVGGQKNDTGRDVAVDSSGNAYLVGYTLSENFPTRNNPLQSQFGGGGLDGFLTKVSADGRSFLYSTYLGGSGFELAQAVAADASGNAYVTGTTTSADFPVRGQAFQTGPSGGGGDTFVTKISTTRPAVIYSTFVGGNGVDSGLGIAVDAQGAAYVSGETTSTRFFPEPVTIRAYAGEKDAFVYKLSPLGDDIVYATFLGGSAEDSGYRIAVDAQGAAYVLGLTRSPNFLTRNAAQSTFGGVIDAFVAKINPAGSQIVYSTFLGGEGEDIGYGGIAVDAGGSAYISGYTDSKQFPIRSGFQTTYGGGRFDGFVARLSPQGNTLLYSSYLGGAGTDFIYGLAVDGQGQAVLAGKTGSNNLPQSGNSTYVGDMLGVYDTFVARVAADASISLLSVNSAGLNFAYRPGTNTPSQTFTVSSLGQPLGFTVESNQPWLRVSQDRTTTPATVTVSVDSASAPPTSGSALVRIIGPAAANSPIEISVRLDVTAVPVISGSQPATLTRAAEPATVVLTGSGFQNPMQVRVNGFTVQSLFVNSNTVQVTVPANLRSSAEVLSIVILNTAEGTQSTAFQVPFAQTSSLTVLPSGILNAATGQPGPIVPGQIITIKGSGFGPASLVAGSFVNGQLETSVGGVRVLIGGIPAPILHAMRDQVSVIVPYALAGRDGADLELEWQGQQRSTPQRLVVGGTSPGLFTADSSGQGQAAATNEDGTPNSVGNPANVGSLVTLYGTGEGVLFPSGLEGRIGTNERPVQPVNVLIGGVPVTPEYAGVSPGSVVGLLQVNVRVPAGVSGNVPVVLNVGGVASRDGVTIAVR